MRWPKPTRIDKYIDKAAYFAQPILQHLRKVIHAACPEATETIKWSFPYFQYQGKNLYFITTHREHCSFGFWLAEHMKDPNGILTSEGMDTWASSNP